MSDIEITTKQHNKIKRAIKSLNDARDEIQSENPDYNINWYLEDSDNLNLMEGESHIGGEIANHDAVIELYDFKSAGGGGW